MFRNTSILGVRFFFSSYRGGRIGHGALKVFLPLEMDIEILGLYNFGVQGVDFWVFAVFR